MKGKIMILIVLLPFAAIGQKAKSLCKSCSHKEFSWHNGYKCDEEKLRAYFAYPMRNDITNVCLCKKYADEFLDDNYLCKNLMPLKEYVSGTFVISSITTKDGFYLDENKNFVPHVFYIIGFSCVDDSCPLPYGARLIVCNINEFKERIFDERSFTEFDRIIDTLKHSDFFAPDFPHILFTMNMRAYFDKDIWALKSEDGTVKTLLGDKPLVDLVYKKHLIPRINIDRFYFEDEDNIPEN